MKIGVVCLVGGGAAFLLLQLGLTFLAPTSAGREKAQQPAPKTQPAPYPDDLMPALRNKPVEKAAAFRKDNDVHGCTVLTRAGKTHKWHLRQHSDWRADAVENTELVLVLDRQKESVMQVVRFADGPAITRYRYDLDAWLIEAKTGRILGSKHFESLARECSPRERFATVTLGDAVSAETVMSWVQEVAEKHRNGPQEPPPAEQTVQGQE